MKEIQKLRSARQRLPSCADSTLGVAVAMSTLSLLISNVVRIVAARAHRAGLSAAALNQGCGRCAGMQECVYERAGTQTTSSGQPAHPAALLR